MKACKYGGTSGSSPVQFAKVREIVRGDKDRKLVVVSAPGKQHSSDEKVTNLLLKLYPQRGTTIGHGLWIAIQYRFQEIVKGLSLQNSLDLDEEFSLIERALGQGADQEYLASRGEYLNGKIMAAYLDFTFLDPQRVISRNGKSGYQVDREIIMGLLDSGKGVVIPGFYGRREDGKIFTFPRGGSDITGALVAAACGASVYENWTDVSGFFRAAPAVVEKPRGIEYMTYREAKELGYAGADVLHPEAIRPVVEARIPINIRNTNEPDHPGTMIGEVAGNGVVTGISSRSDFVQLNLSFLGLNEEPAFLAKVTSIFARYKVSIEHVPTGIDTCDFVVLGSSYLEHGLAIKAEIQKEYPQMQFSESRVGVVTVVGEGMKRKVGVVARIFAALAGENINVSFISQSPSEISVVIGVDPDMTEAAVLAIYHQFFR